MKKLQTGVVGGAGYVGGEMIRLLMNHPNCDLSFVSSRSQQGKYLYDIHPDLRGWTSLQFTSEYNNDVDVIFICMGHGQSDKYLKNATIPNDCIIIDLSRDYRLKDDAGDFVYGLCELNRECIQSSKHIANPGCFATCIQLGLLPLAHKDLLNSEVHVTAVTGSTGAGQKPLPTTHNSWRNNNISIYKPFTHQHLDEIKQSIKQLQPSFQENINFIPMRGSFTRGIFANIYLNHSISEADAQNLFKEYYSSSPFVHVSQSPISVKDVVNTNNTLLHISKFGNKIRIESAIDNLLKGAAGQALQNLNLAMGWPEESGLRLKASAF